MNEATKRKIGWVVMEHLKQAAAGLTALSLFAGIVWFVISDEVEEAARTLAGTDETLAQLEIQGEAIKAVQVSVDTLKDRVDAIAPVKVGQYDRLRSRIFSPCQRGGNCEYVYRVRRTDEGVSCGTPVSERIFIDSSGITYYPRAATPTRPTRLADEWTEISSSFVVPSGASLGIGEFMLKLSYEGCDFAEGQTVVELSEPLIVEIVAIGR